MQGIPLHVMGGTIEAAIEKVATERFAWPGGYALGLVMDDGACLCGACVAAEKDRILESTRNKDGDGWTAEGVFHADADDARDDESHPPTTCDHCGRPVSDGTTIKDQ